MSWITDELAEYERLRAEALAEAERDARAGGKEPFDLAKLERLLARGPLADSEQDHRVHYYLMCPDLKTLEDYVKRLHEHEPWVDAP